MKLFQLRAKASSKRHNLGEINAFTPPHYKGLIDCLRVNNSHRAQSITSRCFVLWLVLFVLVSWSVFLPATVSAQTCPSGNHLSASGTGTDLSLDGSGRVICNTGDTHGISIRSLISATEADINITMTGGSITIKGDDVSGINAYHAGTGNIDVEISEVEIRHEGKDGNGIALFANELGQKYPKNISLEVTNVIITNTVGDNTGIGATNYARGDVKVTMTGGSITTEGAEHDGSRIGFNFGIDGLSRNGNVEISVNGVKITTKEVNSQGILGTHQGTGGGAGNVEISMTGGSITMKKELLPISMSLTELEDIIKQAPVISKFQ